MEKLSQEFFFHNDSPVSELTRTRYPRLNFTKRRVALDEDNLEESRGDTNRVDQSQVSTHSVATLDD